MNSIQVTWFVAALAGMFSFSCMALILKKLTYTLSTPIILFYVFAFTAVLYLSLSIKQGLKFNVGWQAIILLGMASVLALIGNLGDLQALKLAPNPGYASAVKAAQILVITFAALFIFPDQKLSAQGLFGVLLVASGVALIALQR